MDFDKVLARIVQVYAQKLDFICIFCHFLNSAMNHTFSTPSIALRTVFWKIKIIMLLEDFPKTCI